MRFVLSMAAVLFSSTAAFAFTGETTTAHSYAAAVYSTDGGLCGGTLIAPNLVITARHCVDKALDGKTSTLKSMALGELRVAFCERARDCDKVVSVTSIDAPKGGTSKGVTTRDIALLHLAKNVPSAWASPVAPALKKVSAILEDQTLYGVAYGPTTTNGSDGLVRRLKREVPVKCVGTKCRKVDAKDKTANAFFDDIARTEFCSTADYVKGDSGSGVFVKNADGKVNLVAIASYTLGAEIDGRDTSAFSVFERTDEWSSTIKSAAKKAVSSGPRLSWADGSKSNYAAPAWTK